MSDLLLRRFALALVLLGCLVRVAHLDADPDYYGWWGYVFDEGRWVEQARLIATHGAMPERLGHNALIAPLFEAMTTIVIWVGGASLMAGRVFPAFCGCALLVVVWLWLRKKVSGSALVVGVALVAFPADLVVLSRVAVPEMAVILGTTVAFMALCAHPPTPRRMVVAGLLCTVVLGIKLTTIFVVAIFGAVALTLRPPGHPMRERVGDALWFGAGVAAPILVAVPPMLLVANRIGLDVWSRVDKFTHFFGVRESYNLAALPYLALDAPVIVSSALALWLAGLAWLASVDRQSEDLRWMRAATTWAVLYSLVFSIQQYFPGRYRVHVLIPMALAAAHAISRLEKQGLGEIVSKVRSARGLVRVTIVGFLVLVAGFHLAAVVNALTGWLGLDPGRVSTRFFTTLVGWLAVGAGLWRLIERRVVVELLVSFSIIASILQYTHWIVRPFTVEFFLTSPGAVPARLVFVALGGVMSFAVVRMGSRRALGATPALAAALVLVLAWGVHLWDGLVTPRYTARDASIEVARLLAGETDIRQNRAEGLFVHSDLVYWPLEVPEYQLEAPALVVVELPLKRDDGFLHAHYDVVRSFELYVPAGHYERPPRSEVCSGSGQCFAIMRRRDVVSAH